MGFLLLHSEIAKRLAISNSYLLIAIFFYTVNGLLVSKTLMLQL